jgi:hypothetical protein
MKIKSNDAQLVIPAKAGIQAISGFKTSGCRIESGMTDNKLLLNSLALFMF